MNMTIDQATALVQKVMNYGPYNEYLEIEGAQLDKIDVLMCEVINVHIKHKFSEIRSSLGILETDKPEDLEDLIYMRLKLVEDNIAGSFLVKGVLWASGKSTDVCP